MINAICYPHPDCPDKEQCARCSAYSEPSGYSVSGSMNAMPYRVEGEACKWFVGKNACAKCGGQMKPSKAIAQTVTGIPDFPGDQHPTTLSPGGPGKLVDCLKCEKCGHSVTIGLDNQ